MVDIHFFKTEGPFRLDELARLSGASLERCDDPSLLISNVASLDQAGQSDITFFDNRKYLPLFQNTKAKACFVAPSAVADAPAGLILLVSKNPYKSYGLAAAAFYPRPVADSSISPQAIIHETAKIGKGCEIRPGVVIEQNAQIGENCLIAPNVVIGENVIIGDNCMIGACSSIYYAMIGNNVRLHPGVRIGQDGFGFAIDPAGHVPIPQLGRVIIGDRCDIGANSCIDRGAGPDTIIGAGTFIDNLVQIGHNVKLGKNCVIVAQVGLSGSSELGDMVVMAGQSATVGHIKVGSGSRIGGQSAVLKDCPPMSELFGTPAIPIKQHLRQILTLRNMTLKSKENKQ